MLTIIVSDKKGASVVGNIIAVALDQATGLVGYKQAIRGLPDSAIEIADGDVLVLENGKLIAHLVTGPEAVAFRPGGKRAEEPVTVPTFIGPAEPKGRPGPTSDGIAQEGANPQSPADKPVPFASNGTEGK
jgi:hypothetical protein